MSLILSFLSRKVDSPCKDDGMRKPFFGTARYAFLLAFFLALTPAWAKEAVPVAEDPEIEQRMIALSEDLRCLVCQNETIAASRADFANDLRREIREQMQSKKSDKEIVDFLVARYGDFVLYRPPVKPTTLLLWFGPFLLLVIGMVILYRYLRQRRDLIVPQPLSKDERRRAEELLASSGKEAA